MMVQQQQPMLLPQEQAMAGFNMDNEMIVKENV
jgi:hypothetical protein